MSSKPATASALLDALEAWGDEPVVAPVKLVDGRLPEVPASRFSGGWRPLAYGVATFFGLWAIALAWIWWGGGGPNFIYAEF